jgi:hypothetical protein
MSSSVEQKCKKKNEERTLPNQLPVYVYNWPVVTSPSDVKNEISR